MTKREAVTGMMRRVSRLPDEVPDSKVWTMFKRTVTGAVLVGFGIAGAALWAFPWYVSSGAVLLGATTWSGQMVTGPVRTLLGLARTHRQTFRSDDA